MAPAINLPLALPAPMHRLTPEDLHVAEILVSLELYHGDASQANRWLDAPHPTFNRKPPRDLLASADDRTKLRAYLRYEINGHPLPRHLLTRKLLALASTLPGSRPDLAPWFTTTFAFLSGKTPLEAINDGEFGRVRLMLDEVKDGRFVDFDWPEPAGG